MESICLKGGFPLTEMDIYCMILRVERHKPELSKYEEVIQWEIIYMSSCVRLLEKNALK